MDTLSLCSSVDTCLPAGRERSGSGPEGRRCHCYVSILSALVAQWIERLVPVQKAAGPIPAERTLSGELNSKKTLPNQSGSVFEFSEREACTHDCFIGRSTKNVDPLPIPSDVTETRPPCASIIFFPT